MAARLFKSTLITGGMTLLSRVTGFARDILLARLIGTTPLADAFFVAFRIPSFFRRVFGEGAFSQAFVPVFAGYRKDTPGPDVQSFLDHVAGALGIVLLGVTALGVLGAPLWVMVLAPGFLAMPLKYHLTVVMLRITFPYLLFVSLVAMAAGILNTCGYFAVSAFTPILLNVALIASAVWLAPHLDHPVLALAWGVFAAGVLQLGFQWPFLRRLGFTVRPRINFHHPGVRRILRLMLPALLGSSVAQINLVVDTVLASFLVSGSVSWLYYSNRLLEFPLGVFGVALGTVILPALSRKHVDAHAEGFSRTIDWALRWGFVITLPAAVGLAVLAGPLLSTLFQHGAFTAHDVSMARRSLIAFACGLPAFVLIKILAPGYYARQDTRTPMRIGIASLLANIGLNLLLIRPLAHAGLAAATSLAAVLNAGLLFRGLRRQSVYRPERGWWSFFARTAGAALLMGLALYLLAGPLTLWTGRSTLARALWLLFWVMTAIGLYATMLALTRIRLRLSPDGEGEDPDATHSPDRSA